MRAIRKEVQTWVSSRTASASRLGVSRSRLKDLLGNQINKFSFDELVTSACRVGLGVELDDRTRSTSIRAQE